MTYHRGIAVVLGMMLAGTANSAAPNDFRSSPDGRTFVNGTSDNARRGGSIESATANGDCARAIEGFMDPGAVLRAGNLLYVANTANNDAKLVTILDVSTPGTEFVVETIATPVNPIDIAVTDDTIFVIDQDRDALHHRALAGGPWGVVGLPNGSVSEWEYGNIIYAHEGRLFVLHFWENLIDVVDLDTMTIEAVIDDIDHLPNRIIFTEDQFIVLGVGLDAPSCFAFGPNFSLFNLDDLSKVYRRDISGRCALTMVERDGTLFVVFNDDIDAYDVATGDLLDTIAIPFLGRHAVDNGNVLIGQVFGDGTVFTIGYDLAGLGESCNVLDGSQIWFPPIEEMAAMPASDGRVFITNRNDDTLSIIDLPPVTACAADLNGDGQVDGADVGLLLGNWGNPGTGDLDASGAVDGADLGSLLGSWGPC